MFKITEVKPKEEYPGYTFDKTEWTLKIRVVEKKNSEGTHLSVATNTYSNGTNVFGNGGARFENTYRVTEDTLTLKVKKNVEGPVPSFVNATFDFALTQVSALC